MWIMVERVEQVLENSGGQTGHEMSGIVDTR
jgi:hypothetical protein